MIRTVALIVFAAAAMRADIVNGSFETGALAPWMVDGSDANAAIYTSADTGNLLTAVHGSRFAILSTGPGLVACCDIDLTSLKYPSFNVSKKGLQLSFYYDFLTAENNDGTGAPDRFSAEVSGATTSVVASGVVANNNPANFITPGGFLLLPDGTALVYHTGVKHATFSLDPFVGQNVDFVFTVADADRNDEIDSALYLDNVSVSAVPEPAAVAEAAAMAFALVLGLRRRRS